MRSLSLLLLVACSVDPPEPFSHPYTTADPPVADADGDGLCPPLQLVHRDCLSSIPDCDDTDPNVLGPGTYYPDADLDTFGDLEGLVEACEMPTGYVTDATDCDDTDDTRYPGVAWFADLDGDGYGNPAITSDCEPDADSYIMDNTDCDDADVDNWASCSTCLDDDTDGAFTGCDAYTTRAEDCDDTNIDVAPGLPEICGNALDDDCDALTIDLFDADGDGSTCDIDCDDSDPGQGDRSVVNVPSDFATIQAAIDAVCTGSEVNVGPGAYTENIDFGTNDITVQSTTDAAMTVIDGGGAGTVVTMSAGRLDGFTIQNGQATDGGGLVVIATNDVELSNLIVTNNAATGLGGGLFSSSSGGSLQIDSCDFSENSAGTEGGAIFSEGAMSMSRSMVVDNAGANAVFVSGSGTIDGLLVLANSSNGVTALLADPGETLTLTNATISGHPDDGLVVDVNAGASLTVQNTIVAFNQGTGVTSAGSDAHMLRFNDVFGNNTADYAGLIDPTGSDGNLNVDPEFTSTSGQPVTWDLHLEPASPAEDAGDPAILDPDLSTSDMGAYGGPHAL